MKKDAEEQWVSFAEDPKKKAAEEATAILILKMKKSSKFSLYDVDKNMPGFESTWREVLMKGEMARMDGPEALDKYENSLPDHVLAYYWQIHDLPE